MNTLFETGQDGGTATTHDERGDMSRYTLHQGDSREVLKTLAENSVDAIVCDPPYHLTTGKKGGSGEASVNLESPYGRARVTTGFMGMTWDGGDVANQPEVWVEALRVAKPGAWLLAFGGTRTFHRMACAIEDAGWELRDAPVRGHMHQPEDCPWLMGWMYGSGFPKSHNGEWGGTALKPAWEPIVCARKPLIGTVAENWREHGTGAMNIDGCRIDGGARPAREVAPMREDVEYSDNALAGRVDGSLQSSKAVGETTLGRWPANLIHDGSPEVLANFPYTASGTGAVKRSSSADQSGNTGAAFGAESRPAGTPMICHGDEGSAARFFYCAKASKRDRDEGLEHLAAVHRPNGNKWTDQDYRVARGERPASAESGPRKNIHPTVKPTDLMRYLCRLVTPPGGVVLDPFMGSGSTGKAAMREGFNFIGIDLSAEYIEIARARIDFALRQGHQPSLLEAA